MILHTTGVQAEGKLVNVPGDVLWAGMVVDTVDTELHHGPDALHAVSGHTLAGLLTCAVVDRLVHIVIAQTVIARVLVCVNLRAAFDVLMD